MINRKDEFPYPLNHGRDIMPNKYYFPSSEWEEINEYEFNIKQQENNDDIDLFKSGFSHEMIE